MSSGTLEFTVVSATISRDAGFDFEPIDTYATIRCIKEQRSTKTARDQGRLPAWNEAFIFNLEEKDMSKDILVQVFGVKSELDELLGLARIPILTVVGKAEGTLYSLNCPGKGEIGQLKASWRWTPAAKGNFREANSQMELLGMQGPKTSDSSRSSFPFDLNAPLEDYDGPVSYPYISSGSTKPAGENSLIDFADVMAKLSLDKDYSGRSTPSAPPYVESVYSSRGEFYSSEGSHFSEGDANPPESYGAAPFSAYPPGGMKTASPLHSNSMSSESQGYSSYPNVDIMAPGERSNVGKEPDLSYSRTYTPSRDFFEYNYPPIEQSETSAYVARGTDKYKEKDKGHEFHIPYNYPPSVHGGHIPLTPPVHGGYPPPPPPGYSPAYPPPPSYGHPPGGFPTSAYPQIPFDSPAPHGYPPAPHGYPPAPHGYPPAQHGYPPAPHGYPQAQHGYPPAPHGYPQAPHGYPPAPHGYPPFPDHHAAPAFPPYGYSSPGNGSQHQIPDPKNAGHNMAYTPGAYVGHCSHKKNSKHEKHDKHDKHDKHEKHDKHDKHEKHSKHSKHGH